VAAGEQRTVERGHFVRDAKPCAHHVADAGANDEVVVVARRFVIAARGLDHAEVEPARDVLGKRMAELAEQFGAADLEQPKVVAVVHDPHRIAVGEDDAIARHVDRRAVLHPAPPYVEVATRASH
jgi:hypothetical protein